MPGRLRETAGVAALLAVVLLFATGPLWTGKAFPHWDAETFYLPHFTFVADAARQGRLALWNLWVSAGRPEWADPQVGALSPVVLLAAALLGGSIVGYQLFWLGLWVAAGVGVYVLGRHLEAPPWGALVGGAGMVGSGFLIGHGEHLSYVYTFAYLPWVVWRADVAWRDRRSLPAVEAGLLWGLSAVGGYPSLVFANAGFVALWVLGRWLCDGARGGERWRGLGSLLRGGAAGAAVGVVVLAPTYLGFLVEGRGYADRAAELSREAAVGSNALSPAALRTAWSPRLAVAGFYDRTLYAYTDPSTADCAIGALVLALAAGALAGRPRSAWRWWLFGLALAFVAVALGRALPLRGWLYDLLPPTRYFRHAGGLRGPAYLALLTLAMLGATDRLVDPRRWRRRLLVATLGGAVVAALVVARSIQAGGAPAAALGPVHRTLAVGVWLAPAAALALAVRRASWDRWLPASLAVLAMADAGAAVWASGDLLYDRRRPVRKVWSAAFAARDASPGGASLDQTARGLARAPQSRFGAYLNNRNLIAREAVLTSYDPMRAELAVKLAATPALAAAVTGADRIWFSPVAAQTPADAAILARLGQRAARLGAPVLVVHPLPGEAPHRLAGFDALPPMTRLAVELREYSGERLRFVVEAPADGWIWVTDRWAGGWRVRVDGERRPCLRAGLVFRAVEVEAGRHEVAFEYRPFGHPWLFFLSLGTTVAVAVGSVVARRGREA